MAVAANVSTVSSAAISANPRRLIADTIRLLHQNEPLESEKSREIARRYLAMENEVGSVSRSTNHHDFVIFDSAEKSSVYDSFHELRFEVNEFLQNAVRSYQESVAEQGITDATAGEQSL